MKSRRCPGLFLEISVLARVDSLKSRARSSARAKDAFRGTNTATQFSTFQLESILYLLRSVVSGTRCSGQLQDLLYILVTGRCKSDRCSTLTALGSSVLTIEDDTLGENAVFGARRYRNSSCNRFQLSAGSLHNINPCLSDALTHRHAL